MKRRSVEADFWFLLAGTPPLSTHLSLCVYVWTTQKESHERGEAVVTSGDEDWGMGAVRRSLTVVQECQRPSLECCPKMPPALGVPEGCGLQWRDGKNGLSLDSGSRFTDTNWAERHEAPRDRGCCLPSLPPTKGSREDKTSPTLPFVFLSAGTSSRPSLTSLFCKALVLGRVPWKQNQRQGLLFSWFI